MTKKEQFKEATKKITYWDVVKSFNNLNEQLNGESYKSSKNLVSPEGKKVPGFIYTGYVAGVGIRKILDGLNIKYTTHMKGGSGVEEQSEIHIIDAESQKRMLDILEKCSDFYSNVSVELKPIHALNPLLQQIR